MVTNRAPNRLDEVEGLVLKYWVSKMNTIERASYGPRAARRKAKTDRHQTAQGPSMLRLKR